MATAQARLTVNELHQLKWLLGQAIALLAVWALFGLDTGGEALLILVVLGLLASIIRPALPGRIPERAWRWSIPLLVVFIVADFAIHGAQFLPPMLRMVGLLLLYRAFQYRRSREDLQLVLLALFILVLKGVLTVSLLFAFQMLVFTPLTMGLLFLVNLLETTRGRLLCRQDWQHFRWPVILRRLAAGMDFRLIAFSSMLFVCLALVSSLIFVLMPRFRMDQTLGFLQMEGSGKIGFSDTIRFGDVNSLTSDETVALRVRVPDFNRIPHRPYWRMVVLDEYNDGQFRMSPSLKSEAVRPQEGKSYPEPYLGRPLPSSEDDWFFYLEGDISRYLPLLGPFTHMQFSEKAKYWYYRQTDVMALEKVTPKVFGYRVSGMRPSDVIKATADDQEVLQGITAPILRSQDGDPLDYPLTTIGLPDDPALSAYLAELVTQIRGQEPLDALDFAAAVNHWLAENYRYDRSTPPINSDGDALGAWMQQADRGWCEHFTGAFVLLCRAAGIPARAIAGFAGASWNSYEEYLLIRNSDAHAWAEIYDGNGNWVRFDPTPSVGSLSGAAQAEAAGVATVLGWDAWVDSLRMVWYRRVVSFDQQDQLQMAQELRAYSTAFADLWKERLEATWNHLKNWLFSGWDSRKISLIGLWLAGIGALGLVLRYLLLALRNLALRGGLLGHFLGGDPVRRQAGRLLRKLAPLEPRLSHLEVTERQRWQETRAALQAIRFGPLEERPSHRAIFRQARRFKRKARRGHSEPAGVKRKI